MASRTNRLRRRLERRRGLLRHPFEIVRIAADDRPRRASYGWLVFTRSTIASTRARRDPGRGVILKPPKPEIQPSQRILDLIADHDRDVEAAVLASRSRLTAACLAREVLLARIRRI
jgi:hypothetical protein